MGEDRSDIRILGTVIAVLAVGWFALADTNLFVQNIASAGENFLRPFPDTSYISAFGFILGFAFAAIGFGLGQPQVVSRYFAGSNPRETQAAWWIYIGFVQFTWILMTGFGILLRGVAPGIADPETGLSFFFQQNMGPIASGLIIADVYATIASTSNGILVAITQSVQHDLIKTFRGAHAAANLKVSVLTIAIGLGTILLSVGIPGNVYSIVLTAISMVGAGLAGPVMIKVMGWRHNALSLLSAILIGIVTSSLWKLIGLSSFFNEAGIGLLSAIFANFLLCRSVKYLGSQSSSSV